MSLSHRVVSFLRGVVGRRRMERELDEELAFHLEARADHLEAAGLERPEALRQARRELGNPLRWRERTRDARGLRLWDDLGIDVRHGLRAWRRAPLVAVTAIVSIAIGVAAAAAVFSLIDVVMLARAPVAEPSSLVLVSRVDGRYGERFSFTYPAYVRIRDGGVLADVFTSADAPVSIGDGASVEPASALLVSGRFFEVLGLRPRVGRLIGPADDRTPGAHPLVVLAYAYWQRRFGTDPSIVGREIRVTGVPMTVIGVAPAGFRGLAGGTGPDVYVPIAMQAEVMGAPPRFDDPGESWVIVAGRVPPGTSREIAEARLTASLRVPDGAPAGSVPPDRRARLVDGAHGLPSWRTALVPSLAALGGLAGAILLLVWVNVASLLLARTVGRQRELSVRMTLGAGQTRLTALLVVEGLLIASAGGALGALMAVWASHGLAIFLLPAGAAPLATEALAGARAIGFALVLVAATALVCGLVPALAMRSTRIADALRADPRTSTGRRLMGRRLLVSAQVALAMVLLVGAGLFARTVANLRAVDVGVEATRLVTLRLDPSLTGYDLPRVRQLHDQIVERVASVPGVRGASIAMIGLLAGGNWGSGLTLDTGARDDVPGPDRNAVGPGFFRTTGIALVAGREFTRDDVAGAPKVAVVSESFARRYFAGAAMGRRIGRGEADGRADATIVGVVRDGRYASVREDVSPFWYVPYAQVELTGGSDTMARARRGLATLLVRTSDEPAAAIGDLRRAVAAVDPRVLILDARPLRERLDDQLGFERLMAAVAGAAAVAAALLCAIGLYGLLAYDTSARAREIALRLALGASRRSVVALVVGQAATLIGLGLAAGLAAATAASTSAQALLFGLEPTDPLVLAAAVAAVLMLAVGATWLPARRAARVDPASALR